MSFEKANWAYLSPAFRKAHNELLRSRGLAPIPEPAVDLYVPPRASAIAGFDPTDKEFVASVREFFGPTLMGSRPGDEGFSINGKDAKF
jgi:hypothetical protein